MIIQLPQDPEPNDLIYMGNVARAIKSDIATVAPYLTTTCTECDDTPDGSNTEYHGMIDSYVIIGCEGYYQVNPNVIGMNSPNWCDWRE